MKSWIFFCSVLKVKSPHMLVLFCLCISLRAYNLYAAVILIETDQSSEERMCCYPPGLILI